MERLESAQMEEGCYGEEIVIVYSGSKVVFTYPAGVLTGIYTWSGWTTVIDCVNGPADLSVYAKLYSWI